MSGGLGALSNTHLPNEEKPENQSSSLSKNNHQNQKVIPPKAGSRSFFSFQQLNALAVIIVLSASGMVSIEDFAFVVFSFIYLYFISKVAFPPLYPGVVPRLFGEKNRILGIYVFIGAMIGLFLPIAYIVGGICEGNTEGIESAVPHVFLLASQVFMEGVTFSYQFSLPMRVYVPVIYNSVRIFSIMDWLRTEISKVDQGYAGSSIARRLFIGRALAVANLVFWCFNLFGFLLPVYLPKAFKAYYSSAGQGLKVKD